MSHVLTTEPMSRRSMQRWTSNGDTWHSHTAIHAHPGGDTDHAHIFATDQDTLDKLHRVLERTSRRGLTEEDRAEAQELLELLETTYD